MTEAQAVEAILQHWKTNWEALHPEIPWTTDNEFKTAEARFVRIAIVHTASRNIAYGTVTRKARMGRVAVQLFARPDEGLGAIAELADGARSVLENRSIYTAGVDEPVSTYAGESINMETDAAWQMQVVQVGFRYDHLS